jgi:hypothetical protein
LHWKLSSDAGAEVTVVVALTFLLLETGFVGRTKSKLPQQSRAALL